MKRITPEENKKLLVEMLSDVSNYFEQNNIKYYLAFGTLLGAVRHKGFIPWDDDIDLLVPREDFIRLIHLLEEDSEYLSAKNLEILEFNNRPKSFHQRFKIANNRTIMEEYGAMRPAVFIDIFPLDCFKNIDDVKRKKRTVNFISNILTFCDAGYVCVSGTKGLVYKMIHNFNKIFGLKRMRAFYEKWQISLTKMEKQGVLGSTEAYFNYKTYTDVSCWENTVNLSFEGKEFSCPSGYDKVLSAWYGDYLTPPPEGSRHAHESYVMYWKD